MAMAEGTIASTSSLEEEPKKYYLMPRLRDALSTVGATSRRYLYKEILTLLKYYIMVNRHIIHPDYPYYINCGGTPLGIAFNVDRFVKEDVRSLIMRNTIECLPDSPSLGESSNSSSKDANVCSKYPLNFSLPETPAALSGPESDHSVQGYETAVCHDSDDSSGSSDFSDEERANSPQSQGEEEPEYELVTDSDKQDHDSDSDESSDVVLILGEISNQDEGLIDSYFADESDSSSDSECTLSEDEPDQWKCLMCGVLNRPFVRYCAKCWQLRKDWFPDPPKRKKRKSRAKKKDKLPPRINRSNVGEATQFSSDTSSGGTRFPFSSETLPALVSSSNLNMASTSSNTTFPPSFPFSSAASFSSQDSGFTEDSPESGPKGSASCKRLLSDDETVNDGTQISKPSGSSRSRKKSRLIDMNEDIRDNSSRSQLVDIEEEVRDDSSISLKTSCLMDINEEVRDDSSRSLKTSPLMDINEEVRDDSSRSRLMDLNEEVREEPEPPLPSTSTTVSTEVFTSNDLCNICFIRPKNGSIIHGKIAHIGFCYPCVRRLYNSNKRCPVCRRKILTVARNVYV